jgi:NTE family protein
MLRALSLPGCACRGAFQFAVMARLVAAGERFDVVAGASSGSVCGAVTVAGLAEDGPAMWRAMARTPVVSTRYLATERSVFGMSAILREALARFLPEERLQGTEAELLVATTRARPFALRGFGGAARLARAEPPSWAWFRGAARLARAKPASSGWFGGSARHARGEPPSFGARGALVVHSNRERRDMHAVIAASCYIPILYARPTWLDGEVHIDGGAADNTLIDELVARGADEITVVTPYAEGAVSPTMFDAERPPTVPPHVRLRLIFPERTLRQRRFDFAPGPLEEALTMPHRVKIIEPTAPLRSASPPGAAARTPAP